MGASGPTFETLLGTVVLPPWGLCAAYVIVIYIGHVSVWHFVTDTVTLAPSRVITHSVCYVCCGEHVGVQIASWRACQQCFPGMARPPVKRYAELTHCSQLIR